MLKQYPLGNNQKKLLCGIWTFKITEWNLFLSFPGLFKTENESTIYNTDEKDFKSNNINKEHQ